MNEKTYKLYANFRQYTVSQTQVDACKRFTGKDGEVIYLVKGTRGYIVRYNPYLKRMVCTCDNGIEETCWHRRAAVVAERLYWQGKRKGGRK